MNASWWRTATGPDGRPHLVRSGIDELRDLRHLTGELLEDMQWDELWLRIIKRSGLFIYDFASDTWFSILTKKYWWMLSWIIRRPFYRFLIHRLHVWYVREGETFNSGRLVTPTEWRKARYG